MSDIVRTPCQQRSIDKKNKIIQAGYELFSKQGYYNTNTVEIAKQAGVSTGIVYGYFKDKRDILIDVLDIYIAKVLEPIEIMLDKLTAPLNFDTIIPHIIDGVIATHEQNAAIHEALYSLTATDNIVADKFMVLEKEMTDKFAKKLCSLGYKQDDLYEKVHLAIESVQSYSHEFVFDRHPYIDYTKMRAICIKQIKSILE